MPCTHPEGMSLSSRTKKAELQGRVVRAKSASFDGLEATARQKSAKGCFFERGPHRKEKKIAKWLRLYEESEFDFGDSPSSRYKLLQNVTPALMGVKTRRVRIHRFLMRQLGPEFERRLGTSLQFAFFVSR